MNSANIPAELRERRQWVVWKLEPRPGEPKPTKVPYYTRGHAKTSNPDTWMTFAEAEALAREGSYNGVGFVFSKHDAYVGVDLDQCIDQSGLLKADAREIIQMLSPAYIEISQSGHGIHIIVQGTLPPGARRKDFMDDGVKRTFEVYENGRYFAITGNVFAGSVSTIPDHTSELALFHERFVAGGTELSAVADQDQSITPTAPEVIADATAAILTKIDSSPDARFFTTLYEFGETRPGKSPSESDMAMAACLAKYTRDAALIESIMKSSALKRPKWNESRPMPGRKDGTILRRVIAAALRQTPDRITETDATFPSIDDEELSNLPDPAWLIEGLLPTDSGVLLYGRRSSYKSFVLLDMMLSVQAGRPWHAHEVTQGQAVYVAAEGWGGLKRRVHAWKLHNEIRSRLGLVIVRGKTLRTESSVDALIGSIRAKVGDHPVLFLGLDTLNRLLPGIEENAPEAMGHAVGIADRLRGAFPGSTVVWVHHSGWDDQHERGHSSLGDDLDAVIHAEKELGPLTTQLTCDKQKDADEFTTLNLNLCRVGDPGEPLSSLVVESAIPVTDSSGTGKLTEDQQRILEALKKELLREGAKESLSGKEWNNLVPDIKSETFKKTRQLLERGHHIVNVGTSDRSARYKLPDPVPLPAAPEPEATPSGAEI